MSSESDRRRVRLFVLGGTALVLALGALLMGRAESRVNRVALDSRPKAVTVVAARAAAYRPSRRYVGTLLPWTEARVGPQMISAYVGAVLVRPGDVVKRGQVIATLDCRNASASSKAVAMQARAIQAEQAAVAHEAARVAQLRDGGFASANEIERHAADSASKEAQLMESEARMQRASLEVSDCVLRAPFAGEVTSRPVDPGAFVRPGSEVASVVDRGTVRVVAEVPEGDFDVVQAGVPVEVRALATGRVLRATISRRSPSADLATRTVHIEIDVPDQSRSLPVGTTAELSIDVGEPRPATEIPLVAAALRGEKATVFIVDGQIARKSTHPILGERAGSVFLAPTLAPGSFVVTEGRALLSDGDKVESVLEVAKR
jgi:RND family efflux transporter MFP subunit